MLLFVYFFFQFSIILLHLSLCISWKFFATEGFNFSFSTIGYFNVIVRAQDIGVVFYIKLKRNESLSGWIIASFGSLVEQHSEWRGNTAISKSGTDVHGRDLKARWVKFWETIFILYLDCDDDVRTGCRNLSQQQQFFRGPRSSGWSCKLHEAVSWFWWLRKPLSLHPKGKPLLASCMEWW